MSIPKVKRVRPLSDPILGPKIREMAKGKPRPNRKSKEVIRNEAKVLIAKEELIKSGYLKMIRDSLPDVYKAHIAVASKAKTSSTPERKLLFQAAGLIDKDRKEAAQTIADVLADIFSEEKKDKDEE